ncbi:MAG: hypothetical protein HW421_1503 [Ignavibacteria bacterium]|nr:hypothetical protein [Ignavibacteria bacterium]
MFGKKSKLGEVVNKNVNLLPFLRRMELKLGFGDKTIEEICIENNINIEFFIELMHLIVKKYDFNPKYINNFETILTINFLRKSHLSYINESLPKIEQLIVNLQELELSRMEDTNVLLKFFKLYEKDFHSHINYEDTIIFPYILQVEKNYKLKTNDLVIKNLIKDNTIKNYIKQHDSLNEQLNDLKNLLIKYFQPFQNEFITQSLIYALYDLESDLLYHELIENQILFPQVNKMEQFLLNLGSKD